jgi:hypothetical protein
MEKEMNDDSNGLFNEWENFIYAHLFSGREAGLSDSEIACDLHKELLERGVFSPQPAAVEGEHIGHAILEAKRAIRAAQPEKGCYIDVPNLQFLIDAAQEAAAYKREAQAFKAQCIDDINRLRAENAELKRGKG